jgi:ribosomal protein L37AE/L43A
MSEPTPPRVPATPLQPIKSSAASARALITDDKMMCERCGQAEMYRMHAVWRCPSCGYKTDCCGW